MRFSSVIVALFAAASVYSKTTFKNKSDLVRHLKEASADCNAELSKYEVCILTPSSSSDCKSVKGSTCANFYSNPNKYVGHCIGNKKISLFTESSLSNLKSEYKEVCKKLENKTTTSAIKKTTTIKKSSTTKASKTSKTSAAASATSAAAPTAAQATGAATSAAASATEAATSAASNAPAATNAPATDANAPATDANAPATTDANAPAAANSTLANAPVAGGATNTTGSLTNIVTGNSTQNANANANQATVESGATRVSVSLLVTIALVMLSF